MPARSRHLTTSTYDACRCTELCGKIAIHICRGGAFLEFDSDCFHLSVKYVQVCSEFPNFMRIYVYLERSENGRRTCNVVQPSEIAAVICVEIVTANLMGAAPTQCFLSTSLPRVFLVFQLRPTFLHL